MFTREKPPASAPKIVLYAPEGWGKTSFAAFAPGAAIIQCGETGYDTLVNADRAPVIPSVTAKTWAELLAIVDGVITSPDGIKWLAFDALGAIERMLQEFVVSRDMGGRWHGKDGKDGFYSWGQSTGDKLVAAEIFTFFSRLDRLSAMGIGPIVLSHVRIVKEKNAAAADYGIIHPDICITAGGNLKKWADAVLYGEFEMVVLGGDFVQEGKAPAKRGKAVGGSDRVIHTEHNAAHVAKNRYGMPSEIKINCAPEQVWGEVYQHIKKG